MEKTCFLSMKAISKKYGENSVLKNVSFSIKPGEIHAFLGENGAGKSTLMNILFGMPVIQETGGYEGEIFIEGQATKVCSPHHAMELGIGMVHQEFMLIPGFTVAENIKLNREVGKTTWYSNLLKNIFGKRMAVLDIDQMGRDAAAALDRVNMKMDPQTLVEGIPVGYMQFLEIAREIDKKNVKLIVFDEPTAVLAEREASVLLEVMRKLAESGIAIIFITHRLDEVIRMIKLLVLADDLTGAMDTSIQFSKQGISTLVTIEPTLKNVQVHDAEVVTVDMETRHTDEATTRAIVRRLVQEANRLKIQWIYIKVDSTLRGNIGSELEAAIHANGNDKLFFIPAFPAAKRITKNAIQYVNDVPLNETVYASDPFTPVNSSFIPDIISKQADLPVVTVGPEELEKLIHEKLEKRSIIVVDAKNEKDLCQIAKTLLSNEGHMLTAGSAGFATFFPKMIHFQSDLRIQDTTKKTLVVCGSLNQMSKLQVAHAEKMGFCSMLIGETQKKDANYFRFGAGQQEFQTMLRLLEEKKVLILKSFSEDGEMLNLSVGDSLTTTMERKSNREIAGNMGAMIAELVRQSRLNYLVVFGGDTLYGIFSHMHEILISLDKELEPGIVCSNIQYEGHELCVITKAGGFGDQYALTNILRYINRQK